MFLVGDNFIITGLPHRYFEFYFKLRLNQDSFLYEKTQDILVFFYNSTTIFFLDFEKDLVKQLQYFFIL